MSRTIIITLAIELDDASTLTADEVSSEACDAIESQAEANEDAIRDGNGEPSGFRIMSVDVQDAYDADEG